MPSGRSAAVRSDLFETGGQTWLEGPQVTRCVRKLFDAVAKVMTQNQTATKFVTCPRENACFAQAQIRCQRCGSVHAGWSVPCNRPFPVMREGGCVLLKIASRRMRRFYLDFIGVFAVRDVIRLGR